MSRNDQASRILRIISLLEHSSEGMRVPELLSRLNDQGFNCTRRTVYRDLDAIQGCGFPVENSDSGTDTGTWKISRLKNIGTKVVVTYEELLALFLARESLKNYEGSIFYASLESFFKVRKYVGR
ncbi:MAG: HTH domain-containing protein [Bdellovibrionota bacterium]